MVAVIRIRRKSEELFDESHYASTIPGMASYLIWDALVLTSDQILRLPMYSFTTF